MVSRHQGCHQAVRVRSLIPLKQLVEQAQGIGNVAPIVLPGKQERMTAQEESLAAVKKKVVHYPKVRSQEEVMMAPGTNYFLREQNI